MKTFVSAVLIFFILCAGVIFISLNISEKLSELYDIASSLPETKEELERDQHHTFSVTRELYSHWNKSMGVFKHFIGYDILDKADEAAMVLFSCAESGETNEFFSARLKFCDAVQRLKRLCGITLMGII